MSRFLAPRFADLVPYTPGEQPAVGNYIKLNANESPYPPSPKVVEALTAEAVGKLHLYPDARAHALIETIAGYYGVERTHVFAANSSDEILAFLFYAFGDAQAPFAFADITYPFYPVYSSYYNIPTIRVPVRDDYRIAIEDYMELDAHIILANPNANTGLALTVAEIERLVRHRPNRLVIVDEAYVDFGAESCIPLTQRYDNVIVVQTFSKSRSLAGARLGFAIAHPTLITDLLTMKFSFNPYSINRLSMIAGTKAIEDEDYFRTCMRRIVHTRTWTKQALEELGFVVLDSQANFLFATHPTVPAQTLFAKLKDAGFLIRHFDRERMRDFVRISIGTDADMRALITAIQKIV